MALLIVLIPLAIVAKALLSHRHATVPTPTALLTSAPAASVTSESATSSIRASQPAVKTPIATPTTPDCANSALSVSVTTDAQSYAIGSPVTIAMRIANTGSTACKRDVGALPNEVWVTDADGLVIWSSDACQTAAKPEVVIMRPKSVYGNTQVWSGTNSGRDCTSAAADATAGSYFAHARNDTVQAKPYAFTIG